MNVKGYKEGINDASEVIYRIYEKYQKGSIYNAEIHKALEELKKNYDEETSGPLCDICMKLYALHLSPSVINVVMDVIREVAPKNHSFWVKSPIWKKIQYDIEGKPIIPDNSVVRDGYYIDIISLDRLPKEGKQ